MKKVLKKLFTAFACVAICATSCVGLVACDDAPGDGPKAPANADQELVLAMNEVAATNPARKKTIRNTIELLVTNEFEEEDFVPAEQNMFYYWVKDLNTIILADSDDDVVYPDNVKTSPSKHEWFTLSGKLPKEDYAIVDGVALISNEKQLYKLSDDFCRPDLRNIEEPSDEVKTLLQNANMKIVNGVQVEEVLLANNIDMRGAYCSLGDIGYNGYKGTELTVNGAGFTISSLVSRYNLVEKDSVGNQLFYRGFANTVYGKLTYKNINFKDCDIGAQDINRVSVLVGAVTQHSVLNTGTNKKESTGGKFFVEDVKIQDCILTGYCKVGPLFAWGNGTIVISGDTQVKNTDIYTAGGEAGGLFGAFADGTAMQNAYEGNPEDGYQLKSEPQKPNGYVLDFTGVDDTEKLLDTASVTVNVLEEASDRVLTLSDKQVAVQTTDTYSGGSNNSYKTVGGSYATAEQLLINKPESGQYILNEIREETETVPAYAYIAGGTAVYGFIGNGCFSRRAELVVNTGSEETPVWTNYKVSYEGAEYNAILAEGQTAINDIEDLVYGYNVLFPEGPGANITGW